MIYFYRNLFLILFFCNLNTITTLAQNCTTDSLALVALYDSTGGPSWTNTWNLASPMNSWHGVVITNGCVTAIRLQNNNLVGNIPLEIGSLANLKYLHLFNNQITGAIPVEMGNLTELEELICGNNGLTGPIPKEIGNLTKLVFLGLGSNNLSGSIPPELGNLTNSWHFYLNNNQLSGCFPQSLIPVCDFPFRDFSDNPSLPGGGDFDAFCAGGTGGCTQASCPLTLFLTNTISNGTHQAVNTITASNVSVSGDVTLTAGQFIDLQSGFSVESGGTFLVKIEDCTQTNLQEDLTKPTARTSSNLTTPVLNLKPLSLSIKPNPLKYLATIKYSLSTNEHVFLKIYNLQGREVKILLDGTYQESGHHEVLLESNGLLKGLYVVHLQTSEQVATRKIIALE